MDAKSSGDECTAVTGYAYDGRICVPVVCGCVGADCQHLFPSIDECDLARTACYADAGVRRDCTKHADCELVSRRCCPPCGPPSHDDLLAVRKGLPSLPICRGEVGGACPACASGRNHSIYAACIEGTCQMLDVSAHASCTASADCRISTKDCCECGGDFGADGVIAVNASFRAPDYCPADMGCPECGAPLDPNVQALCDPDQGVCSYITLGIK